MSTTTSDFLRHLRTLTARQAMGALSDQQLLERFARERSEASFVVLVQRHGPMVLSVCRRLLHHAQDAEDAFQATFLVLARKAATLRQPPLLSGWLHGAAYHVAQRMKAKALRRAGHERRVDPPPPGDAMDDITWRELRLVLDEELQRLPEKYRAPLVLCYLESRTQDEAARQLGWSKSTFRRRLEQGRDALGRRLTRRGVTLSAALSAPLLADAAAQASLSPLLAASTVRAGLASAMGQATGALVSAQVAALAEGGVSSFLTSKASVALALLVSLTLGVGGLLTHRVMQTRVVAEAPAAPKAAPPAPTPRPARGASKDKHIEIKGRVLDPDGKPFAGARLFLLPDATQKGTDLPAEVAPKKAGVPVRATTNKEGRFHFTIRSADFGSRGEGVLAATAKGFGPGWTGVTAKVKEKVLLRLVADDVPIDGRILDLEGQPVASATVDVLCVARKSDGGDLTSWIEQRVRPGKNHYYWENGLQSIRADLLDLPTTATTGADGKFRLSGFGRGHVLRLKVRGPNIEHRLFWAMTRGGPAKGLTPGAFGFYPATFDMVVGPTKPFIGAVRDKYTGKPLAGIQVEAAGWHVRTATDENGRYCLLGVPKTQTGYVLYADGGEGRPYFVRNKWSVADTPGLDAITVDFDLDRGIEVKGRLTDRATGEPVQGQVHAFIPPDNPHLKDYTMPKGSHYAITVWGQTRPDGTFSVLTIPGSVVLVACAAEENRFTLIDGPRELEKLNIQSFPTAACHAFVRISPSDKDPKSQKCDIALEPGRPLTGAIVDRESKPLTGVHVAGLKAPRLVFGINGFVQRPTSRGLTDAAFTAEALNPHYPRAVVFFHPEKRLGKIVRLRGDEASPFTVRLEPLGAVSGRIVDADGHPRPGLEVTACLADRPAASDDLPWTDLFESGLSSRLTAQTTTDRQGKFRIGGLLPGAPYTIRASEMHGEEETPTINAVDVRNIESGKTKDLGDLKSKLVPEKSAKEKP